jgi:hypothetical protein
MQAGASDHVGESDVMIAMIQNRPGFHMVRMGKNSAYVSDGAIGSKSIPLLYGNMRTRKRARLSSARFARAVDTDAVAAIRRTPRRPL